LAPLSPCGPGLILGVELPLDAFFGSPAKSGLSARDQGFKSVSLQQTVRLSAGFAFERREPRLSARVCSVGWRPGRQRRAECFDIAPTGGNISVAPYSSTAVPLMACENATPIATTRGSGLNVKQIFEFASGSSEAERDPLIVPGKRQTGVLEGASLPSSRAGGAHRGSLG